VGGPGGLSREVFGFALASSLSDPTVGYPSWNLSLVSTVAFFGLHVQDDGTFAADSGATVWNSSQLTGLVTAAHAHATKVVLTIILQDFTNGTPHMCAGLSHTGVTVTNAVAEMKAKGVDGINVDYEGLNGSCGSPDSSWARHTFTAFVANLKTAMAASYLSVDTYASSAADPLGFYDIPGLAPSADSFFVMAYDLEYSNYGRPPTSCGALCLGPTAPLTGYYYNDTLTAQQYMAAAPASKVILGVPYYGRKACVVNGSPNQSPTGPVTADSYLDAIGESTAPGVLAGSYGVHRDANDPGGEERYDTWYNTTMQCTRELYWDDTISLGHKYDLVNSDNLRGVGIWNLNYGGGAPELWNLLAAKFTTTTQWTSMGGMLTSGPDSSSSGATRVDAFVRGSDNGLWQNTWNGSAWIGWTALGGALTADPGAVSWGANRIDAFARGSDNALYHKTWNGTAWGPWESLGGILSAGPDVASWGTGRLDVFVRGSNNALYHKWWDGQRWSGWEDLGGILTSGPTAVSWGPNRIDVLVRGTDSGLWHKAWDGQRWTGWEPLGGFLSSGPDASSCASGHLDVFANGSDHAIYQLGFNGRWGTWQRLGGYWTGDPSAVCPSGTAAVHVLERGTDGALWASSVQGS
jgi:spore germination protein YaaH